jgi:hypothetical protein
MQSENPIKLKTPTDHIGFDDTFKLFIPNNQLFFISAIFPDHFRKHFTRTITTPHRRLVINLNVVNQKDNLVRTVTARY